VTRRFQNRNTDLSQPGSHPLVLQGPKYGGNFYLWLRIYGHVDCSGTNRRSMLQTSHVQHTFGRTRKRLR
jgi:hypothetical protein